MLEKITLKTNFSIHFVNIELFLIFEIKSCLSTSVFIFSTIFQILETTFYVFWTQTCGIFLKYHMPLRLILYEMLLSY